MYCKNCGERISEHAEICIHCGVRTREPSTLDKPNWVVNILTLCCTPVIGLIMYFVWKHERPAAAKSALLFFFLYFGLIIFFSLIFVVIGLLDTAMY